MATAFQPPRLKSLSARRAVTLCALDMGTSKTICLIARLDPLASGSSGLRTHSLRILGIGYQRSRGVKGGQIVDMDLAESSARMAIDAAERMANLQVEKILVSTSGGRFGSRQFDAEADLEGGPIEERDIHDVLSSAYALGQKPGRSVLHAVPMHFAVDGAQGLRDPRGLIGAHMKARLQVASCDSIALGNLWLAVERCHLGVSAFVASPYAAGLSALLDDEAEMGATIIDFGGGTTSAALFEGGALAHLDAIALGGQNVTLDLARGLNIRLSSAERLKCQHGCALASAQDDRETITIEQLGEEGSRPLHVPRMQLIRIVRPRVEEILELTRDRLRKHGLRFNGGSRIVLTGGASQLPGLTDMTRAMFGGQVRIGRPIGVEGLPESGQSPVFAASVGALIYPQLAGREHYEIAGWSGGAPSRSDGYFARVGRWLKNSF